MSEHKITVSRKLTYAIGFVVLAVLLTILGGKSSISVSGQPPTAAGNASVRGSEMGAGSAERFALLSGQGGERSVGST